MTDEPTHIRSAPAPGRRRGRRSAPGAPGADAPGPVEVRADAAEAPNLEAAPERAGVGLARDDHARRRRGRCAVRSAASAPATSTSRTASWAGSPPRHASVEMGLVGGIAAREARVSQGVVRTVVAQDVRIEQSVVRAVVANQVEVGPTTAIGFVIARRVDGERAGAPRLARGPRPRRGLRCAGGDPASLPPRGVRVGPACILRNPVRARNPFALAPARPDMRPQTARDRSHRPNPPDRGPRGDVAVGAGSQHLAPGPGPRRGPHRRRVHRRPRRVHRRGRHDRRPRQDPERGARLPRRHASRTASSSARTRS